MFLKFLKFIEKTTDLVRVHCSKLTAFKFNKKTNSFMGMFKEICF